VLAHARTQTEERPARIPDEMFHNADCAWVFIGQNVPHTAARQDGGGVGEGDSREREVAPMKGRPEHTDSIAHSGTWHMQLAGSKVWFVRPNHGASWGASEGAMLEEAQDLVDKHGCAKHSSHVKRLEICCSAGDLLLINTRLWFHATEIPCTAVTPALPCPPLPPTSSSRVPASAPRRPLATGLGAHESCVGTDRALRELRGRQHAGWGVKREVEGVPKAQVSNRGRATSATSASPPCASTRHSFSEPVSLPLSVSVARDFYVGRQAKERACLRKAGVLGAEGDGGRMQGEGGGPGEEGSGEGKEDIEVDMTNVDASWALADIEQGELVLSETSVHAVQV
jgi:hypothetical protein